MRGSNSETAAIDGVLVVDKPVGPTSHDVVAAARRALGIRRVGHTGTLDPQAAGVLPLVLGRATRLAQHLSAADKEYDATIRFGIETDTYDSTGRVTRETGLVPSSEALDAALGRFRGTVDQMPPPFSAKKVGGERAYARARRAADVHLAPVPVTIYELTLDAFDPPLARVRLVCSTGFYVRSLAHDVGAELGCGAVLDALVRVRVGAFTRERARSLETLATDAARARRHVIPLEGLLLELPAVRLTAAGARRAAHGQDVGPGDVSGGAMVSAGTVRLLTEEGRVIGLAEPAQTAGFLHPAVVLR